MVRWDRTLGQRHHCHGESAQGHLITGQLGNRGFPEGGLLIHHLHAAPGGAGNGGHDRSIALIDQKKLTFAGLSGEAQTVKRGRVGSSLHEFVPGDQNLSGVISAPRSGRWAGRCSNPPG